MSTTITWSIAQLERHTADGVVYTVHYRVDAADGTYTSGAHGSVGLKTPEDRSAVIPFADLTEEIVVDWVKDALSAENVESLEAHLEAKIAEQHAPTTATGIPW